jgi:hypothetical protein
MKHALVTLPLACLFFIAQAQTISRNMIFAGRTLTFLQAEFTRDLHDLNAGTYLLTLNERNSSVTKKLIKR